MKLNLTTESIARTTSRHPWITIGAWAALLVMAVLLTVMFLGDALTSEGRVTNNPESQRANRLIEERIGSPDNTISETVIIRSSDLTVDDPAYRTYVEELFSSLTALGNDVIAGGVHYYLTGDESLVSRNRHTTLMPLVMPADADSQIESVHEVVDGANNGGSFEVLVTGDATFEAELKEVSGKDLQRGEVIGISAALVVLILVFGAVAAALLPILLAVAAVTVALGATALVGQTMDLSFFVTNMITMMGLAVGIDYSLFIVSRYREERAKGLEKLDAIAAAGATANRAVLFSGLTVVLALCGLLIFPLSIFLTMGIGAILVVIAALLASLTLLPAVLGLLGDRVNAFRIPFIQRRTTENGDRRGGGLWSWIAHTVMSRPIASLILASALLLVAAIPYFDLNKGFAGISTIPDDLRSKEAFVVLQEEFGYGQDSPALVVIDGPTESQTVQAATMQLETALAADPAFTTSELQTYPEANLSILSVRLSGDPSSKEALEAVSRLRTDYIPQAVDSTELEALVTGGTAEIVDFNRTTDTYTPIVFTFVLGLSFLLLTVAFRSIVVPVKAIIMNLLSVGAAYGLLVLVFQKGVGAGLLGFQRVDAVESWIPLFLFSVLFGLSMDYHVFLLSRIRERFNQTGNNTEAVAFGLRSTGRLITGAAAIMVAVFAGFALGDLVMMQEMGFGLAVAVLMDATIVRSILVPASMRLLGKWNWYLPKWLEFVPTVAIGELVQEQTVTNRAIGVPEPVGEVVPVPDSVRAEVHLRDTDTSTDWRDIT